MSRVLGVGGLELVEQRLAAGELALGLRELGAAGVELGLAVVELRGRGGEVGGAGVEAGLRLERVDDAA